MRRAYESPHQPCAQANHNDKDGRKELGGAMPPSVNLNILQRGWGFEGGTIDSADIPGLEEQIGQIEAQLLEIGGDDRMFEVYLDILIEVLGRPEEHLWGTKETLILDSMGIKRNQVASNVYELTFPELFNSEGRSIVLLLVTLSGEELRRISG
jgi:hypothetical protein